MPTTPCSPPVFAWAALACASTLLAAAPAQAQAIDPARVPGLERPAVERGDGPRTFADGLLFLPREAVRLGFLAGGVTAGLIRDRQVVPRVGELLSPSPGNVSIIPSLFVDTRRRAGVGAQMLASGKESGTRLSLGFGGVHDLLAESRMHFGSSRPVPLVLSLEGLLDERSKLDYLGVGQHPEQDERNHFREGAVTRESTYLEERTRVIVGAGVRVARDVEVFLSTSFTRSRVHDSPDGGGSTISAVFVPGTVPGAPAYSARCPRASGELPCGVESRVVYSEAALRLDTRPTAGRPSAGALVEGYFGYGLGTGDDPTRFFRVGGRGAYFVSILRATNVFSVKLAADGMFTPSGAPAVPFTSLVSQPDFRGLDNRIDHVSFVASFDYRYSFARYLGASVFVDLASVGHDVGAALDASFRVAGGLGVDVHSSSTELSQMLVSFSKEGARALVTFGVPVLFGDRQHRR